MPQGGSVTLFSLLPIALCSYLLGPKKGIMAGIGVENDIRFGKYMNKSVVKDETLITAKGPYLAGEFALKICETLFGTSIRHKLEKEILFRSLDI